MSGIPFNELPVCNRFGLANAVDMVATDFDGCDRTSCLDRFKGFNIGDAGETVVVNVAAVVDIDVVIIVVVGFVVVVVVVVFSLFVVKLKFERPIFSANKLKQFSSGGVLRGRL